MKSEEISIRKKVLSRYTLVSEKYTSAYLFHIALEILFYHPHLKQVFPLSPLPDWYWSSQPQEV